MKIFLFCFKYLHGEDGETGNSLGYHLKMLKKFRVGGRGGKLGTVG